METAMQRFLNAIKDIPDGNYITFIRDTATELLEVEREQISKGFDDGAGWISPPMEGEQYYQQKYGDGSK